ncbi:tRNA (guanosine(46)-N7)-methyltransferase TrmB [Chromatiales bacterium (ex Bugula neritina AB1)]|nr:tRNA (guanosine(46)-N7)-methyltransferase TrmB [Chromatiales bacterium (ex Bugula neritina AB1)]
MGITLSTRSIRTFVLRQGRLTEGQQRSLDLHWSKFGLDVGKSKFDLSSCFSRTAPVWMEIGFGNGEALAQMAQAQPEINFLGVEVHLPGVGHALVEIVERELTNVRLIRYDALELLEKYIEAASIDRLSLFFPDPWHKKRHHKRRIVNAEFLGHLYPLLADDGILHMATDWHSYAHHMEQALSLCNGFRQIVDEPQLSSITASRPTTKFEQRGRRLGHEVFDLAYIKA